MKKFFSFLCSLLIISRFAVAQAEILPLTVSWSYSGTAASYILYKDGVQVCVSNDPGAQEMTCNIFIEDVPMTFTLTAVDADGVESQQSAPYTLNPPVKDAYGNYIPQPSIVVDASAGDAPFDVTFDASGSIDILGTIVSYDWDFGDGETGNGPLLSHSFVLPASYIVTLIVEDDSGASAQTTVVISATDPTAAPSQNVAPIAVLTATPVLNFTSRIGFDAYSSSDADGTISAYYWDFGDGDTAVGEYVEHEFLTVGDYTVVLTIVDDEGTSAQDQIVMSVVEPPLANTPPIAAVSASSSQQMLHFYWVYAPGPDLAGFNLYQNGIQICSVSDPNARQADCPAYVDSGIVEYWVTSYDVSGVESDPSEIFNFDSSSIRPFGVTGDAPLSVHFSSGGTFDTDGTIVSYHWGFGDGTVGAGSLADHIFDLPGVYTVTLTVTDDAGDSAQATTDITVTGLVNEAPTVSSATFTTEENRSITGTLSASDQEGDSLTFSLTANGSLGTCTITDVTHGVFTYVPNAGMSGSDTFSFKVNDGTQDSTAAQVAINIVDVNVPPVAQAASVTIQEDQPWTGILQATDADSDQLTYSLVAGGSFGAVVIDAATGAYSYSPNTNAHGTDTFSFVANDGTFDSAPADVTIVVSPVNDTPAAVDDSAVTDEDTPVVIDLSVNDSDVDGDALRFSLDVSPANGTVSLTGSSAIYTPVPDFNGSDAFSYLLNDNNGGAATGQVTVTVNSVNDVPIAVFTSSAFTTTGEQLLHIEWSYPADQTVAGFRLYLDGQQVCAVKDPAARALDCLVTAEDRTAQISLTAFDSNNQETAPLNITVPMGAELQPGVNQGLAPLSLVFDAVESQDSDGTIVSYDWDFGDDTQASGQRVEHLFSLPGEYVVALTVTDDAAGKAVAQQAITVTSTDSEPTAANLTVITDEDTALTGMLSAADADGNVLTYSIVSEPANGAVVIPDSTSPQFTYTPTLDFNGSDSFTYKVNDGRLDSKTATVEITVFSINDPPVSQDDTAETDEDTPVAIDVFANDSDADGDILFVNSVSQGSNGTVLSAGNSVTYTPGLNFSGVDSFTYEVTDTGAGISRSTVTVTVHAVNDVPTASAVSLTTDEDASVTGALFALDLDGDSLTYSIVSLPANGSVVLPQSNNQQFTYSPNPDFNGTDLFTYKANDGAADSNIATVTITILAVNDSPVAQGDTASTDEDTPVTVDVLANDSDVDGDTLSFIAVSTGAHGSVVLAGNNVIYTPEANFNGADEFSYIIADGQGSSYATVSVIVSPVNDLPVLQALSQTVVSGQVAAIDVLSSAADIDGDPLVISSVTPSSNAKATAVNGVVEYAANAGFWGDDTLTYMISDGNGGEVGGIISITVEQPMSEITYSWDFDPAVPLVGFNFYRNGVKICETKDPVLRKFTCTAPVIEGSQTFAVTAVDAAGSESTFSNLMIVPPPSPTIEPTQVITYNWTYTGDLKRIMGFKLYMNGAMVCDTDDPGARSLSFTIPKTSETKIFKMISVDRTGVESEFSNPIKY